MVKYDIVLMYEHKVRELENLCLLQYELVKRGYKVKILFIKDKRLDKAFRPVIETELLVMAYCYDTQSVKFHVRNAIKFNKIIDMQWEQAIYKEQEDNPQSFKNFAGIAKNVAHISWGSANYERLINVSKIEPHNVKLVGNISMDFLREEFKGYYKSREELLSEYNIPHSNKVCLFIASFKFGYLNDQLRKEVLSMYGEERLEYYETAVKTRKIAIDWILNIIEEEKNITFIYRPHPGENTDDLCELQNKYDRFKVIRDFSVKQWIVVCDKIITWLSTTVAEVFFAKKNCAIIYPLAVPANEESRLLENSDRIKSYDEFKDWILSENISFPVTEEKIEKYYHIDVEKPVYIKIVEVFEDMLKDDKYTLTDEEKKQCYEQKYLKNWIYNNLVFPNSLYGLYKKIIMSSKFQNAWILNRKASYEQEKHWDEIFAIEYADEQEIEDEVIKVKNILGN